MIRGITLGEFKCFRPTRLPLASLTVLTGTNGAGKSTVIQSLLALRQSNEQGSLKVGKLALNGDWTRLGTGRDVLNEYAEGEEVVSLGLDADNGVGALWRFAYRSDAEELQSADEVVAEVPDVSLFGHDFQYLCAERIGPRTAYEMTDFKVRILRQLGATGQHTAQFLAEFGADELTAPGLLHPQAVSRTLKHQTEAWLGLVASGVRIAARTHRAMDVAQLQFAFAHPLGSTMDYRPTNVGFGLTYALPVIVAVLAARPEGLVIVENPESHLHPQGQAELGRLLALAAAAGIQVILETHSDHVLNGVRVAVKQGLLLPEAAVVLFLTWKSGGQQAEHVVNCPRLDKNGRFDSWPDGFFDQWDRSLDLLVD